MRLKERAIVVTGAAQGIGRVYARRLASEGARVVVADVDERGARDVANEVGGLAIGVDVADRASVERLVQATLDAYGRVDGLVNNAALFGPLERQPIEDISVELWDRVMAVNVRGVFLLSDDSDFMTGQMMVVNGGAQFW